MKLNPIMEMLKSKSRERDLDKPFAVNARAQRRAADRRAARHQRKGQRAFNRQQRAEHEARVTLACQLAVAQSDDPKLAAMRRNVENDLAIKAGRFGFRDETSDFGG